MRPIKRIRIGMVGCGKSKAPKECKARHLYTGNLFKAALAHAERDNNYVFILSAFHGLIRPDDIIQPYDRAMPTTVGEQETWVTRVIAGFQSALRRLSDVHGPGLKEDVIVTIYAGAAYTDMLAAHLQHRGSYTVVTPLRGMAIGQRLKWLKDQGDAHGEVRSGRTTGRQPVGEEGGGQVPEVRQ